jgi:hypothetical protein
MKPVVFPRNGDLGHHRQLPYPELDLPSALVQLRICPGLQPVFHDPARSLLKSPSGVYGQIFPRRFNENLQDLEAVGLAICACDRGILGPDPD